MQRLRSIIILLLGCPRITAQMPVVKHTNAYGVGIQMPKYRKASCTVCTYMMTSKYEHVIIEYAICTAARLCVSKTRRFNDTDCHTNTLEVKIIFNNCYISDLQP